MSEPLGKKRVRKAAPDRIVTRSAFSDGQELGYVPPFDEALECRVLGAVIDPGLTDAWPLAQQAKLKPKAFFVPANRSAWQAVCDMKARGVAVDAASLMEEMKLTGALDEAGGPYRIAKLVGPATSLWLRQDLERLRMFWELRQTIEYSAMLRDEVVAFTSREEFSDKLSQIGQRLIRFGRAEASMTLVEHIEEVERDIEHRIAGTEDRTKWVYTGMPTFDKRLKPLNNSKLDGLVVVGGGSGHGKSALMRQWAWNCLKAGGSVLFYTLETDIESLIEQMASTAARVDLANLPDYAKLYPERIKLFRAECAWLREIAGKRFWVEQHGEGTQLATVEDLESHYRAHANLHGHPTLVVVDYLQILETKKRTQSREQTVATVSHALKRLKLESGNCWLVGAQLNESGLASMRQPARDAKTGKIIKHPIPGAGALRESQAIYHDADRVIMLYCPCEDCRGNDNWGANTLHPEIWLCQIKCKKGATGWVKCWFDKRHTHFRELTREEAELGEDLSPAAMRKDFEHPLGQQPGANSRPATKAEFLNRQRSQGGRP